MIYFLAFVAAIAGFLFGYDEGVIAVARASLEKDLPMSPLVGGFMTAAVPLGALVAASVAGPITDRFGRRAVLIAAAALFAVGALAAAGVNSVWMLVIARFVLGLAIGMAAVAAPLYIAECAPLESRGAMVSTYQLAITVGILASYLTGLVVKTGGEGIWRIMFGRMCRVCWLAWRCCRIAAMAGAFRPTDAEESRRCVGGCRRRRRVAEMVLGEADSSQRVGYSALLEPP